MSIFGHDEGHIVSERAAVLEGCLDGVQCGVLIDVRNLFPWAPELGWPGKHMFVEAKS